MFFIESYHKTRDIPGHRVMEDYPLLEEKQSAQAQLPERSIYRNELVVVRGTSAGKQKKVVVGTLVIGTLFLMTKTRKNMKQPNTGDLYISTVY